MKLHKIAVAIAALSTFPFQSVLALEQINDQVYVRGTNNNWVAQAMTLIDNNTWEITSTFADSGSERFKFDTAGDWSGSLGDTDADGVVEATGTDIQVLAAGTYKITFYGHTSSYRVSRVDAVSSGEGTVNIDLNLLSLNNAELSSSGANEWEVYLDGNSPFGGPIADARTDASGEVTLNLSSGEHSVRFYKMTGSSSYELSSEYQFIVRPNEQTTELFVIQSGHNQFKSFYNVPWGKSLFITGSTSLLGNWNTAFKLNYQSWCDCWYGDEKLVTGLDYKLIMADWVTENQISTSNASWELQQNRQVTVSGSVQSNESWPQF